MVFESHYLNRGTQDENLQLLVDGKDFQTWQSSHLELVPCSHKGRRVLSHYSRGLPKEDHFVMVGLERKIFVWLIWMKDISFAVSVPGVILGGGTRPVELLGSDVPALIDEGGLRPLLEWTRSPANEFPVTLDNVGVNWGLWMLVKEGGPEFQIKWCLKISNLSIHKYFLSNLPDDPALPPFQVVLWDCIGLGWDNNDWTTRPERSDVQGQHFA